MTVSSREPLIDLIESALHITRGLETRKFDDPRIVELTPVERLVIQYLERTPGASLHDVAAEVNLQVSNASAAIKRLVDVGLVERERDPEDGRRMILSLTRRAAENLGRVHEEWLRVVDGAGLEDVDVEVALRVLRSLDGWIAANRRATQPT
ncbi:MarR family winged helix-turn-helix transcriptional regulator [Brevibacterium oceani]|uniref:MarR family winged helix-turn-helix transcriptional regulator n=1 Tax=Brevibacterium oceani TaxID=358099 RepID=UPI001B33CF24|nr:MarR family winged helix-turn-helix transcriptional regulator [Brevibacterium oceani]